MKKDYYEILGISKTASEDDIKRAYRKLAHQYHPDKATGDEKKFKEINEAYQVLSNKEKRAQYDQFGQVFEGGMGSGPSGGFGGFEGFGFGRGGAWDVRTGEGMGDFGDIFETIFEQFGGGARRQTYTHGSDIEITQEISLEDAFRGVKREVYFETQVVCDKCSGIGYNKSKGAATCSVCRGKGEVKVERRTFFGNVSQVQTCSECSGRGEVPNEPCSSCKGKGRIKGRKSVVIELAPGIEDGQVMKMKSVGEAGEKGAEAGDLYVVVKVKLHRDFERKKDDLVVKKEVKITDALLGNRIELVNIDGEKVHIEVPPGFNVKDFIKVPGKGMPRFGSTAKSRGDLYVGMEVKTPRHLSKKARELIVELDKEL